MAAIFILLAWLSGFINVAAQTVLLDVVYPRLEGRDTVLVMPRVDSTFAFGSVQPADSRIYVNGAPAQIWQNGAFLAFVALDTFSRRFDFIAISPAGDSVHRTIPFRLMSAAGAAGEIPKPHPLNRQLPARITISQEHAALRTSPDGAYTLLPLSGSVALADSFVSPYYRVRLSGNLHVWVEERFATLDTTKHEAPAVVLHRLQVRGGDPWTRMEIPMAEPILFQLEEDPEIGCLTLDLYGAVSGINRIDYDPGDPVIKEIRWTQLQDEILRLEIFLNGMRLWGYGAAWEGDPGREDELALVIKIRRPPRIEKHVLKNRTIVLDPGHGGMQPGAVGPTRLLEKEPNLKLALKLQALLEKRGARAILTRSSDSTAELYDRVDYAIAQGGEILISLHNNALSDGENPFWKRGSAVYYYHPQSRDLAWILHRYLLQATRLPDYGLYYQNLALARPTEMPAVLIECAFMIHPEEEALLRKDQFLSKTAAGIAAGLENFLSRCREERQ